MKKTTIIDKAQIELSNPILIEGFPGLGMVGKIAVEYLSRQLKAHKLAELYSPHYAYYVLVDHNGSVRLLQSEFEYWINKNAENDVILLTGDSQPQTIEGQYEVADTILEFAKRKTVQKVITIGGYRKDTDGDPNIFVSSTSPALLGNALECGAKQSPSGNPIVGTAGLLLGLSRYKNIEAMCLLAETPGYLPDPKGAKSVLEILLKILKFDTDLSGLDKEIQKSKKVAEKIKKIGDQMKFSERRRQKIEDEKVTYIS